MAMASETARHSVDNSSDKRLRQHSLKIALIVGDLSESGAGRWGGGVRPFLLTQALQQLGHQVTILGFRPTEEPALPSTDTLPIIQFPRCQYPQMLGSTWRLLRQLDADILYAYKPKPTSFGVGLWKKLVTRWPLILDIDDWEMSWFGGEAWQYQPNFKQLLRDVLKSDGGLRQPEHPFYLKQMERLIHRADAVTVHTQFLQHRFGGTYVPNGKDTTLFDPARYDPAQTRQQYGLSDYWIIMFPGAPRPYKGLEDVLAALDILQDERLRLVIVGGSPYDNYDQKLLEKGRRWIIQLPKTPYEDMPALISAADLIIVPQRETSAAQAQFPLKLTDGMAMAKPILSSRVGDIPEIMGDTGYLVDPGCPEQIADKIQEIFQNLELACAKGLKARERCIKLYSVDSMSVRLSKVIDSLGYSS